MPYWNLDIYTKRNWVYLKIGLGLSLLYLYKLSINSMEFKSLHGTLIETLL